MEQSDGTKLCLECGLCCLGFFLGKAKIRNERDMQQANQMKASVTEESGERYFDLPCPAFDGKCTIYANRPTACEGYRCNLLKSVESKEITLENALQITKEMKEIAFELDTMLSNLEEDTKTREIAVRFHKLYSIGQNSAKNIRLQKEYGKLYIKYIAFDRLNKRYFYDE